VQVLETSGLGQAPAQPDQHKQRRDPDGVEAPPSTRQQVDCREQDPGHRDAEERKRAEYAHRPATFARIQFLRDHDARQDAFRAAETARQELADDERPFVRRERGRRRGEGVTGDRPQQQPSTTERIGQQRQRRSGNDTESNHRSEQPQL